MQLSFANASVLRLWKGTKHLIKIIGLEKTKELVYQQQKKITLTANSKSKFDSAAEHFIMGGMFINFKEIVD